MSKKKNIIKQWVEERGKMCEKRSVAALIKFMEKWTELGIYDVKTLNDFKAADKKVQKLTLCKMIYNSTNVSEETIEWAMWWCLKNGYNPMIK